MAWTPESACAAPSFFESSGSSQLVRGYSRRRRPSLPRNVLSCQFPGGSHALANPSPIRGVQAVILAETTISLPEACTLQAAVKPNHGCRPSLNSVATAISSEASFYHVSSAGTGADALRDCLRPLETQRLFRTLSSHRKIHFENRPPAKASRAAGRHSRSR